MDDKIKKFSESDGVVCPFCGKPFVEPDFVDENPTIIYQYFRCWNCHRRFSGIYELTGFTQE